VPRRAGRDPGLAALRSAARGAIVMLAVLAFLDQVITGLVEFSGPVRSPLVSAADQRYPAIGGGQPELAAGAGAGQESEEALAVDRCPGDRGRAPALGERLLGVPVAGRVAERRGGARVQAAQRDTAATPLSRAARITLRW
jgi:hypothetical protein